MGELELEPKALLEDHLKRCKICCTEVEQYKQIIQGLREQPSYPASGDLYERFAHLLVDHEVTLTELKRCGPPEPSEMFYKRFEQRLYLYRSLCDKGKRRIRRPIAFYMVSGVAAALLLILPGILTLWRHDDISKIPQEVTIPWTLFSDKKVLPDGSTLRSTEDTLFQVLGHRRLRLIKGEVWLNVAKGDDTFRVETRAGVVMVRGTEFVVRVIKERRKKEMRILKDAVAVLVIAGVVELVNPAGAQIARSGEYIYAQQDGKPQKGVFEQKLASEKKIQELIKKLGSDDEKEADEAQKQLEKIGKQAVPKLNEWVEKMQELYDDQGEIDEKEKEALLRVGHIILKTYIPVSPLKDAKKDEWVRYKFRYRKTRNPGGLLAKAQVIAKISVTKTDKDTVELQIKPEKEKVTKQSGRLHVCCGAINAYKYAHKDIEEELEDLEVDIDDYIHSQLENFEMLYNGAMEFTIGEPSFIRTEVSEEEIKVAGKKYRCTKIEITLDYHCPMGPQCGSQVERTYWFSKGIPVMGLVKMKVNAYLQRMGIYRIRSTAELVSYGTEDEESSQQEK
jgi:hypothetical protein